MFGELDQGHLQQALEALLFVTDEPVSTITLADMLETDAGEVETALLQLQADLAQREAGVQLLAVAGGWRLATHPLYHDLLEKYVLSWDTRRLTQAALETLAIIAYLQPVTRAAVANVRGVNSDSPINSLVDKGLVREAGRSDAPGNPMQYATTRTFLEKFGLRSVRDLPPLQDYAPDQETVELLKQGLSVQGAFGQSTFEAELDTADGAAAESVEQLAREYRARQAGTTDESAGQEGLSEESDSTGSDDRSDAVQETLRRMMRDAVAQTAGVVDKIDFDDLEFEE